MISDKEIKEALENMPPNARFLICWKNDALSQLFPLDLCRVWNAHIIQAFTKASAGFIRSSNAQHMGSIATYLPLLYFDNPQLWEKYLEDFIRKYRPTYRGPIEFWCID